MSTVEMRINKASSRTTGRAAILIVLALACSRPVLAMERYVVTTWGHRDGLPSTLIYAITQTRDGYLWLGTSDGLVRFDGITFDHQKLIVNSELMLGAVTALHGAADGSLWIGSASGLVTKMSGRQLSNYRLGSEIEAISEMSSGSMWVFAKTGLYRFEESGAGEFAPAETVAAAQLVHMSQTGTGAILLGQRRESLEAVNDNTKLVPVSWRSVTISDRLFRLNEDRGGGTIWLTAGPSSRMHVAPIFWRDRRGYTWTGTFATGLLRTTPEGSDEIPEMTTRQVESLLEDREGDIWVGTNNGLYRFRYSKILSLTTRDGLRNDRVSSVVADGSGVWIGTESGLDIVENDRVRHYLRGIKVFALKASADHTVWAGTNRGVFRVLAIGRSPHPELMVRELSSVTAIEEDSAGCMWLLDSDKGIFRWRNRALLPVGGDPNFRGGRISLLHAQSNDSVWIGFSGGGLSVYKNDAFHEWPQSAALNTGTIYDVYVENPDLIWLAADHGLYALRGKTARSWNAAHGLPGNRILWLQPDGKGWIWLGFSTGIARVRRSDLNRNDAGRKLACDLFDFEDGLLANPIRRSQAAASQDSERRLWVTTSAGIAIVDARHIDRNEVPPNVSIQRVIANNQDMPVASSMQFRPGTRNLEIDYAGLSLAVPQKVRFRYHLEGYDKNWQDVNNRRQAFYTNLPPGPYHFQVVAANSDGVWNETGSRLDFTIEPTFPQTALFKVLCLAALALLAVLLYRLRVRSLQAALIGKFEARLAERTRIAQELHDELLQSAMGVSLQIELVDSLVDTPAQAKTHLQKALTLSRALMQKGRAVLRDLRETTREARDLVNVLSTAIDDARYEGGPVAILTVEGTPRPVNPLVADDVGQIGCQAIVNAFQHSEAKDIRVELDYRTNELRLQVSDNGCGIDARIAESGKLGHYGVIGMRERAHRIGGTLHIVSVPGQGTQVTVSVPGRNAYRKTMRHD